MTKTALKMFSAIGLLILSAGVSAKAQTQYRAHIPFDFTIGEKSFKAGDYTVRTDSSIIAIREAKGSASYMTMVTLGADYS
ncbi:MAG: hypothetical protein LC775_10985, partial [Acidobacteria bacterium]|nr:hypothetical protein [Acidobacteriota bacterium]